MSAQFYHLLYSRSKGIDYRWILVPPFLSSNALRPLRDIFVNMIDYYRYWKEQLPPLFGVKLPLGYVLVQFVRTSYKDKDGRVIYSMQGLAVPNQHLREFWYSLPWIIQGQQKHLNPWQYVNFDEDLDKYTEFHDLPPYRVGLDDLIDHFYERTKLPTDLLPLAQKGQIVLSYNEKGFNQLLEYIASPVVPLIQFAFGCSLQIQSRLTSYPIIAPLDTSAPPTGKALPEKNSGHSQAASKPQLEVSGATPILPPPSITEAKSETPTKTDQSDSEAPRLPDSKKESTETQSLPNQANQLLSTQTSSLEENTQISLHSDQSSPTPSNRIEDLTEKPAAGPTHPTRQQLSAYQGTKVEQGSNVLAKSSDFEAGSDADLCVTKLVIEKRGLIRRRGNIRIVAEIQSGFGPRVIAYEDLNYPPDQYELLKTIPTPESNEALKKIKIKLRNFGWQEIPQRSEYWWFCRFQRKK